jgi:hypothetical protein
MEDEERSPRGPNDVRMMFATVRAAKMCVCCTKGGSNSFQGALASLLTLIASGPCVRVFLACSRTMINGRPY